jgi:hypothetical protein
VCGCVKFSYVDVCVCSSCMFVLTGTCSRSNAMAMLLFCGAILLSLLSLSLCLSVSLSHPPSLSPVVRVAVLLHCLNSGPIFRCLLGLHSAKEHLFDNGPQTWLSGSG